MPCLGDTTDGAVLKPFPARRGRLETAGDADKTRIYKGERSFPLSFSLGSKASYTARSEEEVWDRSLPRPVGEADRRSVRNRKERQDAATMRVSRVGSPNVSL